MGRLRGSCTSYSALGNRVAGEALLSGHSPAADFAY